MPGPRAPRLDDSLLPEAFVLNVASCLRSLCSDRGPPSASFPVSLCAAQRKYIHQAAQQAGLTSQSTGDGAQRHITVFRRGGGCAVHEGVFGCGAPLAMTSAEGEMSREERLSRILSSVLRHRAEELGLHVRRDGFVLLRAVLQLSVFRRLECTEQEVVALAGSCGKQRFSVISFESSLWIRANQGHTIATVDDGALLRPVLHAEELQPCVHGTYLMYWESIRRKGLWDMGRNHIHFIPREPGDDVVSGMRSDVQLAIYIDARRAMTDGCEFFWSLNGVVLTRGFGGCLRPVYFLEAVLLVDGFGCKAGSSLPLDGPVRSGGPMAVTLAGNTSAIADGAMVAESASVPMASVVGSVFNRAECGATASEAQHSPHPANDDGVTVAGLSVVASDSSEGEEVLLVAPILGEL